jgi:hypothetical protein
MGARERKLTIQELDLLRAKSDAFDEALEYLSGRAQTQEGTAVETILRTALAAAIRGAERRG